MTDHSKLGPWVRRFLLEHMIADPNLSCNTQKSYRDTLALLLPFAAVAAGKASPWAARTGCFSAATTAAGPRRSCAVSSAPASWSRLIPSPGSATCWAALRITRSANSTNCCPTGGPLPGPDLPPDLISRTCVRRWCSPDAYGCVVVYRRLVVLSALDGDSVLGPLEFIELP